MPDDKSELTKGQRYDVRREISNFFKDVTFTDQQTEKLAQVIASVVKVELAKDRERIEGMSQSMLIMKWVLALNLGGVGYFLFLGR